VTDRPVEGTERPVHPLAEWWVAAGTLLCAALIAGSVALPWYADWVQSIDPDTHAITIRPNPLTGSGLDMVRRHEANLSVAPQSRAFVVGGIEENVSDFGDGPGAPEIYRTDYYTSFLGPGVTILLAAGLAAVGVMIATRRARKRTLLTGLWIALVSWLAAGSTALADSDLFEVSGAGLQLWVSASVVAVGVLGVATWSSSARSLTSGSASQVTWAEWPGSALACVLAFLLFVPMLSWLEEQVPFAAAPILGAFALMLGIPAAGVILALESARSHRHIERRQRRRPTIPTLLTLAFAALLWGLLLLSALSD